MHHAWHAEPTCSTCSTAALEAVDTRHGDKPHYHGRRHKLLTAMPYKACKPDC
jgi:hypothetical protein